MLSIIIKGGYIMIPILLCSVISLTITIERVAYWMKNKTKPYSPEDLLEMALRKGPEEMAKAAGEVNHPVARVLEAGALHNNPSASIAMEAQAIKEASAMKRFLPALDTIVTLAPLLGLLGTIVGMIQSFDIISLTGLGQPHAVTGGVAEALIATAAGLIVAILTLIPYNILSAKAEKATEDMERYATRFEVVLHQRAKESGR